MRTPDGETTATDPRRERLIGILLICCAFLCFSCLDATAKWLNREIPTVQTVWARYLSAMVLVSVALRPWVRVQVVRTRRPGLQALRSLLLLGSTAANFIALRHLQLAETTAISFATPFLVVLFAAPILGERVGGRRLAAIILGFVGVLVVLRPGTGTLHWAALVSLGGAFFYAAYNISTRLLASWDSAQTTTFYSSVAGVILLTPLLPWFWTTPPSPWVWAAMGGMGLFAGIGHYLLTLAHQRAPAGVLSPFMYTQMLWMVVLGWFVFGDLPDRWTVIGAALVTVSGLFLLDQERRRGPGT
jgi:drug/metabolite transporter (DMT)-like permease